jgi:hypothetical protein
MNSDEEPRGSSMPAPLVPSNMMGVEQQRAIAETQAAMFVAKQFPRDFDHVLRRLKQTCSRKAVAENAAFSFPRGGEEVTGPSVYLLKTIAQEWGNLTYGVRELSRTATVGTAPGRSQVEAFAWDMERNVREIRNFDVKHWRDTRSGGYALKDERDIYELIANMGSRRLRACLEGVIPEDVKAFAVHVCEQTMLSAGIDTPEYRQELLAAYAQYGITRERIEARLGKNLDAATANQLVKLTRGVTAIKDGVTTADEAFPPLEAPAAKPEAKGAAGLRNRLGTEPTREPGEEG